jgi:2-oxoglutarate dehydrogenase E1 component
VIDDPARAAGKLDPKSARRVLLCSGKVYYTLLEAREEHAFDDVALVRVEQIHPFPFDVLRSLLAEYAARDFVWVQEEPWNMGAWYFIQERMRQVLPKGGKLRYVGRPESASPATGSYRAHEQQQAEFVEWAFATGVRTRRGAAPNGA